MLKQALSGSSQEHQIRSNSFYSLNGWLLEHLVRQIETESVSGSPKNQCLGTGLSTEDYHIRPRQTLELHRQTVCGLQAIPQYLVSLHGSLGRRARALHCNSLS